MAYRLSQRHQGQKRDDSGSDPDAIDWQKIGWLFLAFSVLSLLTSFYYMMGGESVMKRSFQPARYQTACDSNKGATRGKCSSATIGPITVDKDKQVYEISVEADNIPLQSWAFVEGQVLDANKQYLFSFGEEFWHESGYDDGGRWEQQEDNYDMTVTIPEKGRYYLRINTQSDQFPDTVKVNISAQSGSSIPHLVYAIILAAIGGFTLSYVRTGQLGLACMMVIFTPFAIAFAAAFFPFIIAFGVFYWWQKRKEGAYG